MADDAQATPRAALVAALHGLGEAVAELRTVLDALDDVARQAVAHLEAGTGATEVYSNIAFTSVRDRLFAALDRFDTAFTNVRAQGVRLVVEEEGARFTDVARLVGRSRQFVTRLYRQAAGQ